VADCRQSAFEILTPPPQGSDMYGIGWRILEDDNKNDDKGRSSKDKIIHLARKVGDPNHWCSTCYGGGLEQSGFRATIKARVEALGSGNTPPLVSVMRAYSTSVVNPDTMQSSLVDDNPCQHFFGMDEFFVNAGTSPKSTPSPTIMKATPVPTTMRINAVTTDWPSNFPSDLQSTMAPSDSQSRDADKSRITPAPETSLATSSSSPAPNLVVDKDITLETVEFSTAEEDLAVSAADPPTTTFWVMKTIMMVTGVATTLVGLL
jgi:hypothetical protein